MPKPKPCHLLLYSTVLSEFNERARGKVFVSRRDGEA